MKNFLAAVMVSLLAIAPAMAEQSKINTTEVNTRKTQMQPKQIPTQYSKYEIGEYSFDFAPANKTESDKNEPQNIFKQEIKTNIDAVLPDENEKRKDVKPVSNIVVPDKDEDITPVINKTETLIKEIKPITTDTPVTRTIHPVSDKIESEQNIVKQMKQIEAQEKTTKVIEQNKKSLEAPQKTIPQAVEKKEELLKDAEDKFSEQSLKNIEQKKDTSVLEKYDKGINKSDQEAVKKDVKKVNEKINNNKSKSEKKIKYDKDKPPVPFKIVPKYYEGGATSSVERL